MTVGLMKGPTMTSKRFLNCLIFAIMLTGLAACGGGGGGSGSSSSSSSSSSGSSSSSSSSSSGGVADTTPDAFSFSGYVGVSLDSVMESDAIIISGVDTASPISITGGEYSIDGGSYTSDAGLVSNGQTVTVRQTSSGNFSTTTYTTLVIGGVSGTFRLTTGEAPVYYQSGEYALVEGCVPFQGDPSAPLKVFFISIDSVRFFQELRDDGVEQFRTIEPFSQYFDQTAFYSIDIQLPEDKKCTDESGFGCDDSAINEALLSQCTIDDHQGVIKIAILESFYGGTGGEIIYMGSPPGGDLQLVLDLNKRTVIHEVGHNFGLADLYSGGHRYDGGQYEIWPKEISRKFLNVDGPGCAKWCNSYKPASEYTGSPAAQCPTFQTKEECLAYNRDETGYCTPTAGTVGGNIGCCSWLDEPAEYFETQCVPILDWVDIGLDCYEDSGCYLGAAYANHTWRPARTWEDSIMYGPSDSDHFDAVSLRELNEAFRCCLTAADADPSCEAYRSEYADFMFGTNFKKRIGSCGVKPAVSNSVSIQSHQSSNMTDKSGSKKYEPIIHHGDATSIK